MRNILVSLLAFASAVCRPLSAGAASDPQDWPTWRGPDARGSTESGNYPQRWKAAQVAWKVALPGKGSSTPIVWQGHIYLTTPAEGQDAVMSLDLTGKQLWLTRLGPVSPAKHQTLSSSCNPSPVTDGGGVFVYFRSGCLAALELDGRIRWQTNLVEQFGRESLFWDAGTSPVVTDRHVILSRLHGGDSWIGGFDKATGELRWREPRTFKTPTENNNVYNTPVLFQQDGKPTLLVWGADHLTAHDAENGKVLWSCDQFNPKQTDYWPPIASPVIHEGIAVVPVGRDDRPGQASLHAVRLGGSGDVTETHRLWKRDDVGVFVTVPVVYQGRIYLLRHRGGIECLDPRTGATVWTAALPAHAAPYYASPVVANGVLYAAREDGVVFSARVGDKFELLSENPMGERIVASPVPVADRLLLRGDNHLFCVQAPDATTGPAK